MYLFWAKPVYMGSRTLGEEIQSIEEGGMFLSRHWHHSQHFISQVFPVLAFASVGERSRSRVNLISDIFI